MNTYLENNINPSNYTDGINPKRLQNLKGDISLLTHLEFEILGDSEPARFIHSTNSYSLTFNHEKRISSEYSYMNPERIRSITQFKDFCQDKSRTIRLFDEKGQIEKEQIYDFDKFGVPTSECQVINGIKDCKHFELDFNTMCRIGKWSNWYYEPTGMLLRSESKNLPDNIIHYTYHENGRLASINSIENSQQTREEIFNEMGYLVKLSVFHYKGIELKKKSEYEHNYDGNLKVQTIESHEVKGEVGFQKYLFYYNSKSQLVEVSRIKDKHESIGVYKYNKNGDVIYKKYENEVTIYGYSQYDKYGNWIEKIETFKGTPFRKYLRKIEYFD